MSNHPKFKKEKYYAIFSNDFLNKHCIHVCKGKNIHFYGNNLYLENLKLLKIFRYDFPNEYKNKKYLKKYNVERFVFHENIFKETYLSNWLKISSFDEDYILGNNPSQEMDNILKKELEIKIKNSTFSGILMFSNYIEYVLDKNKMQKDYDQLNNS